MGTSFAGCKGSWDKLHFQKKEVKVNRKKVDRKIHRLMERRRSNKGYQFARAESGREGFPPLPDAAFRRASEQYKVRMAGWEAIIRYSRSRKGSSDH